MKLLSVHSDFIEFQALSKALPSAEELKDKNKERVEDCLVLFLTVEKTDEVNPDKIAELGVREIEDLSEKVKCKKIVLYPFVHLSSVPSSPAVAVKVLKNMESALSKKKGFTVVRAPFGWYKSFDLKCKGHPLAELSRQVLLSGEVTLVKPEVASKARVLVSPKKSAAKHGEPKQNLESEERVQLNVGRQLDLFLMNPELAPGFPFYPPNGVIVRNALMDEMKKLNKELGYKEVWTPHAFKTKMWYDSGHMEAYLDKMYVFEKDGEEYGLKPMNCPAHVQIFQRKPWSYREFPEKYSEIATVYRYEQSGELTGLLRVRALTMDDGHAFVREDQIESEVRLLINAVKRVVSWFGFEGKFMLSTRAKPGEEKEQKYVGSLPVWEKATIALAAALRAEKIVFEEKPGEAAFYGPKIDVDFKDSVGKWWQCSTIQLDFNLPERFKLEYVDSDGSKKRPVMIHRAFYGTLDRFIGVLLEHFKGSFPTWLAPVQALVLPVSDGQFDYARKVGLELSRAGLRVEVDDGRETLSKKIVNAHLLKVPYMLVVGDKEAKSESVTVRDRGDKQKLAKLADFEKFLLKEISVKALEPGFCK